MLRANHPRHLAAWVLVSLLLGTIAEARKESPARPGGRLAVIELNTPPTMIGLGAQVMQQIVTSGRQQGYTIVTHEEIEQALGRRPYEELQKCGGDPACVSGKLSRVGVDHAVVGSLGRDDTSYLLKLFLVDVAKATLVADVDRSILIASRRFRTDVSEAVPRMLRGEKEARGTLVITTQVKNVEVWVDGVSVGRTPVEVELKPGRHEVRLEKRAYLPVRRLVDVEALKVTTPEFRMLLEPGAVPDEEQIPALVKKSPEPTGSGLRVPTAAWAAFGAAAAAGATGVYFGSSAQRIEHALAGGFDPDANVYEGTRAQALQGRNQALTANILYGVAGAAAATGIVLTLLESGEDEGAVTAVPVAGPSGAGVQVGGRF